jgi:hypothetical protein
MGIVIFSAPAALPHIISNVTCVPLDPRRYSHRKPNSPVLWCVLGADVKIFIYSAHSRNHANSLPWWKKHHPKCAACHDRPLQIKLPSSDGRAILSARIANFLEMRDESSFFFNRSYNNELSIHLQFWKLGSKSYSLRLRRRRMGLNVKKVYSSNC